jgi:hypothetical protein
MTKLWPVLLAIFKADDLGVAADFSRRRTTRPSRTGVHNDSNTAFSLTALAQRKSSDRH